MSDLGLDDNQTYNNAASDTVMRDMDDGDEAEPEEQPKERPRNGDFGDEEEEEERDPEEEEDDEDEEDEEDEDEEPGRKKKRVKRRHNRSAASRFLDIEAEVSDEDEEDEDEEELGADGFIDTINDDDEETGRRHHALLDNTRHRDGDDKSPEQIARDLSKRYGGRAAVRYTGDMNEIPQRLLMPSVHDASLWQVRVKPGRERDIVFSLMRKAIDVEYTARPLNIVSAFQRDSLPGMIYVEARSSAQVSQACNGLVGVYPSRGIQLVPIEEMASLLQIKKQDLTVTPGSWVRIRRGKYQGDLAQVMDITENGEDVGLKFIPRIDLNPRDDGSLDGAKKRKKPLLGGATMRPPQRLFNYEEVIKVWGRKHVSKRNQVYVFQNDTYKDGFIEKDFKLSGLVLEDVNPTLDEITQFTRRQDGAEVDNVVDLSIIAEASRKAAVSVLQPGDHVEVFEGEQAGVHGVVEEINQDVVTITAVGVDIDGQKVELPARSVRKRFKPGDHVKVMTGQNADETGLVVSVADNVVTFLSDMSMQEVSVFSKDLREAAEVGSGTNIVGNYELHDLVQLDAQTVGVIFKTERDSFRVLDQNGQIRLVQPHQISMRRDSTRAIATDSEGHELRINDNMKEVDGEGRKGRVLHIHQSFFAFLHNRDVVENGGVFVTRARSLVSLAPKGNLVKTAGADLSKMNPAMIAPTGGMVGSGNMGRGPRDRDIGMTVTVIKGAHKGYVGTIKDTNGLVARVELRTGNKVITIEKDKLMTKNPAGQLVKLGTRFTDGFNPANRPGGNNRNAFQGSPSGGRTPGWTNAGRTPNPYEQGRTPAWNTSSRTPNPYAEGGKTPAWNASSRTPNPYAAGGGRTPAWSADSRTPNPYASGSGSSSTGATWGGATPGRPVPAAGGWGGATPGRNTAWGSSADEGWSPARQGWDSAPTSWGAPTPAASAATPAFNSAATPATAPTPGPSGGYNDKTPAGAWSYHANSASSAPTPGGGWGAEPELEEQIPDWGWIFDPALANILPRMRIEIKGTRQSNYLNGDYEGRKGHVLGASRVGSEFEQTAMVQFDDGEKRSIQAKHIRCLIPGTDAGQEAVALKDEGKARKGMILVIREDAFGIRVTVSTKENKTDIFDVDQEALCILSDE